MLQLTVSTADQKYLTVKTRQRPGDDQSQTGSCHLSLLHSQHSLPSHQQTCRYWQVSYYIEGLCVDIGHFSKRSIQASAQYESGLLFSLILYGHIVIRSYSLLWSKIVVKFYK